MINDLAYIKSCNNESRHEKLHRALFSILSEEITNPREHEELELNLDGQILMMRRQMNGVLVLPKCSAGVVNNVIARLNLYHYWVVSITEVGGQLWLTYKFE